MKKTVLASVIAGMAFSGQALAVELYNSGGSTFSVGGHISMGIGNDDDDELEVQSISPRININATQDLGHGWSADVKGEWSVNTLEGGDNSFSTRLGYIGVTHETWGRGVGGTQWSPYYDVGGIADMPIAFANDFLYVNGYELGTGRAERMISYRKTFNFGDNLDFNLGAGWQGDNSEGGTDYGNRGQLGLSVDLGGIFVGYAFTTGSVSGSNDDAMGNLVSAKYGTYGDGLFIAAVYEMGDSFRNAVGQAGAYDSYSIEAIAAFALANSLNFSLNYESHENDDDSKTVFSQMALQVEYNFTGKFMGYAGYQIDLGDDYADDGDDKYALGVRYYL
ncbi:outer membrane protein N [Vibrio inusitatus NBRC 102082]|uniref:Outer membrane protein N n=1 Tax=Vibrio inusitatus NBRC 102082 TaxID=1219070 RepID=A0A4Y3HUE2_9VIBR|nr:porin [Vibrio inusitatus]GEA50677.1 outer membrane protein N [Vibrio inusitatus NBRC 102082]